QGSLLASAAAHGRSRTFLSRFRRLRGYDPYTELAAEDFLERLFVCADFPEFQMAVSRGRQLEHDVFSINGAQDGMRNGLQVTAVEALGDSQEDAQHANDRARALVELGEFGMLQPRKRLVMKQRGRRDDRDFGLVEPEQVGVADHVIRVG